MFSFLKNRRFQSGALEDNRPEEERIKDFRLEELIAAAPAVEWIEKKPEQWRRYPVRDQAGSSSCVAFSKALELGILNQLEENEFVLLSARDIYTRRVNQGSLGMWGWDANNICLNYGSTLEILMPSDKKDEAKMNDVSDRKPHKEVIGRIFRAKNWLALPFDIDTIASVIASSKKGVNLFFKFSSGEWWKPVPTINIFSAPNLHHSVVAVDYTLWNGKKALIIQDSAGPSTGFNGLRVITKDWFDFNRITWASYFEDLTNWNLLDKPVPPKHTFNYDLYPGTTSEEVKILQDCLKFLSLFPKTQTSTGYFGGITRKGVKAFQILNDLEPTGYVGAETRAKLNKIFS